MNQPLIIRGRYSKQAFIPSGTDAGGRGDSGVGHYSGDYTA